MPDVPADVGIDVALGQGRAGDHHSAPRRANFGALIGPSHEQQRRTGVRSRVHSARDWMLLSAGDFVIGGVPLHQQFGGEGFAAHVLQTPLVRNVPSLARPSA